MNYYEYFDVVFLFPLLLVYKFILDFNWLYFPIARMKPW